MDKSVPTPQEAQDKRTKDLFFKALELTVGSDSPTPKEPKFKTVAEERGDPVPATPPPVEEQVIMGDSLASLLTRGKLKNDEPVVETVEEKKPEEAPVVEEKKPDEAPLGVIPPPEKKEEKKPKPKPIPVPEIDPVVSRPVAEKPVEVDVGDVSDLTEDELYEVDLAKFAERTNPAKYTGRAKAVVKYIRDHRKVAQELSSEDPDGDIASNPKYQRFVKSSRPEFTAGERNRLTLTKIKEEAKRELQAEMEEKYVRPMEQDLRQQKAKPAIQKTVEEFTSQVAAQMPTEEDDPIVQEVTGYIKGQAKLAAEEFLSLSSSIKPFDSKNQVHTFLADFIENQGQQLVASKSPYLKRGNQTFLPRAQFNSLAPAERAKHFTFTDEDVLQMLVVNARTITDHAIKEKREYFEKLGYTKAPKATKPKEAPVVTEEEPTPKASLSSSSSHTPVPAAKKKNPFIQFVTDSTQK